ncbi:hypothetical protein EV14_1315 [Prochlorococcus sp. MIT 0703]|nr:hypothetical protein EV12_0495 [Prochlorococcus sp. MIT 0701]KGG34221.1 hypothetical protein EV14_1315 [Prochlorococcus sp. MIT 0703]
MAVEMPLSLVRLHLDNAGKTDDCFSFALSLIQGEQSDY